MFKHFFFFCAAVLFCTGVAAQYFYKDIWNTGQLIKDMSLLKQEKVRSVSIKSFDEAGEPVSDFFCEKKMDNNYTLSETLTRSSVTSQSLLSSYFNAKGYVVKTVDSSESFVNTTRYAYDDSGRVISVETSTKGNGDAAIIYESRGYVYTAGGKPERMVRKKDNTDISTVYFKPDEKGNVAEEEEVFKNGASRKYFYYYDQKNNLTDIVHYNARAKRLLPDYMYEYDAAGRISQMITVEEGGGYYIWRYAFNDRGLRESERCLSREKKLLGSVQYVYR